MNGLQRRYYVLPRHTLFPREIFRRDEEDRRRRCRGHRRGGLTKYSAEKIRGTAGVVRELCGLERPGKGRPGRMAGPSSPGAVPVQGFGAKSNPLAFWLTTPPLTLVKKL